MTIERHRALAAFQWELRASLEFFLNNGWYGGTRDWSRLHEAQAAACGKSRSASPRGTDSPAEQAAWIADCYSQWVALSETLSSEGPAEVRCEAVDLSHYGEARLRRAIEGLAAAFDQSVESCLFAGLHGSMATLDYTPYSDIDALVVLTPEAATDPDRLLDIRRQTTRACSHLYAYDPLQHHGVFACTGYDLRYYPEAFLPLATLQRAKGFSGACSFDVAVRNSADEAHDNFRRVTSAILSRSALDLCKADARLVKLTLSACYLVPCLFLGAIGEFCYKGDSFGRIGTYIDRETLDVLTELSRIRDTWSFSQTFARYEGTLQRCGLSPRWIRRVARSTTDKLFLATLRERRELLDRIPAVVSAFVTALDRHEEGGTHVE
ncbi:MAG: nucleotidyltransferase domain-containing protein [Kiritimatiellae bacterium]|nr:nucleotidyltransferase domain-containing protein [Kiritimatiellia bacterium]